MPARMFICRWSIRISIRRCRPTRSSCEDDLHQPQSARRCAENRQRRLAVSTCRSIARATDYDARRSDGAAAVAGGATNRWRLISHLSLNHLVAGRRVGRRGRPARDPAAIRLRRLVLDRPADRRSVLGEVERGALHRFAKGHTRGFAAAWMSTSPLTTRSYPGTGFYLLASVLEHFFGQYATINSFTRLIARSKQREFWEKQWAPRTGNLTLT